MQVNNDHNEKSFRQNGSLKIKKISQRSFYNGFYDSSFIFSEKPLFEVLKSLQTQST